MGRTRRGSRERLRAICASAGGDDAADGGGGDCGCDRVHGASGVSAAAGGFSDDQRGRGASGCERGDHGVVRGDAAGAAVWAHCGSDGDDLVERAGLDRDHDPVRPEPEHRRGGARRAGGDQRGADVPAGEPAGQPDVSQGEPGGRADHDSGADQRRVRAGQAVRHSVDDHAAEAVADPGGGPGGRGGRGAAVGAGGGEPQQAGELRDDDGDACSRCCGWRTRTWRGGRSRMAR